MGLCIAQRFVGMISLTSQHRYFLYRRSVDMRKSFDGLSGVVRNELGRDPMDGEVYIFLNRQRSLVKLLVWDRSGWAIWAKRLERGSYELPPSDIEGVSLSWSELVLILEGISLGSVRHRRRYSVDEKSVKRA
jgi:transposase